MSKLKFIVGLVLLVKFSGSLLAADEQPIFREVFSPVFIRSIDDVQLSTDSKSVKVKLQIQRSDGVAVTLKRTRVLVGRGELYSLSAIQGFDQSSIGFEAVDEVEVELSPSVAFAGAVERPIQYPQSFFFGFRGQFWEIRTHVNIVADAKSPVGWSYHLSDLSFEKSERPLVDTRSVVDTSLRNQLNRIEDWRSAEHAIEIVLNIEGLSPYSLEVLVRRMNALGLTEQIFSSENFQLRRGRIKGSDLEGLLSEREVLAVSGR